MKLLVLFVLFGERKKLCKRFFGLYEEDLMAMILSYAELAEELQCQLDVPAWFTGLISCDVTPGSFAS